MNSMNFHKHAVHVSQKGSIMNDESLQTEHILL